MFQTCLPVCVGMDDVELVGSFQMFVRMFIRQAVVGLQRRCVDDQVGTGLVEGNRVERSSDTQVGHDGGVVVVPAVALG